MRLAAALAMFVIALAGCDAILGLQAPTVVDGGGDVRGAADGAPSPDGASPGDAALPPPDAGVQAAPPSDAPPEAPTLPCVPPCDGGCCAGGTCVAGDLISACGFTGGACNDCSSFTCTGPYTPGCMNNVCACVPLM